MQHVHVWLTGRRDGCTALPGNCLPRSSILLLGCTSPKAPTLEQTCSVCATILQAATMLLLRCVCRRVMATAGKAAPVLLARTSAAEAAAARTRAPFSTTKSARLVTEANISMSRYGFSIGSASSLREQDADCVVLVCDIKNVVSARPAFTL